MDENLRTTSGSATAIYILLLSVVIFAASLIFITTGTGVMYFAGFIFMLLAVYLFFASLRWFKKMKREQLISEAEQQTLQHLLQTNQSAGPTILSGEAATIQHPLGAMALQVVVLAQWEYTADQWQQFLHWERKERKTETLIVAVLVGLLGTFILRLSRSAPWPAAIAVSTVVALLYGLISYYVALNAIQQKSSPAQVVITKDAVLVNGHYNRLNGENLWLERVVLKRTDTFSYIEFTTGWTVRTGKATGELRIPVPAGKETEAITLVDAFGERIKA